MLKNLNFSLSLELGKRICIIMIKDPQWKNVVKIPFSPLKVLIGDFNLQQTLLLAFMPKIKNQFNYAFDIWLNLLKTALVFFLRFAVVCMQLGACFWEPTNRRLRGGVGKSVGKMTQQFGVTLCFFPFISAASGSCTLSLSLAFGNFGLCKCTYAQVYAAQIYALARRGKRGGKFPEHRRTLTHQAV